MAGAASMELRKGWPILLGATLAMIAGVATLPAYTAGVFITALQGEFGWSRAAISLASSTAALGMALSTPFVGGLAERFHPRTLMTVGMLGMAASFLALSRVGAGIGFFYLIHLFFSIVGNLSGAAAVTPLLAANFERARGIAIGVTMGGVGLGGGLAAPLLGLIIQYQGWRAGYAAMGCFCLVMAGLVWFLVSVSRRPSRHDPAAGPRPPILPTLRGRTFQMLSITFFLVTVGTAGLLLHFVPMLTDWGVDPPKAAAISSLIGICIVLSRVIVGVLTDRFYAPRVAAAIMFAGGLGFAVLGLGGASYSVLGAIALGLTFGAEVNLVGFLVGAYFNLRIFGRLFGILYTVCAVGSMASAYLYGEVRDVTGSYAVMIAAAAICSVISAALFLLLPAFPSSAAANKEP